MNLTIIIARGELIVTTNSWEYCIEREENNLNNDKKNWSIRLL